MGSVRPLATNFCLCHDIIAFMVSLSPHLNIRQKTSLAILITTNLFPILGIIFWGWQTINLIFIYWAESAIICFFCTLKIFFSVDDFDVARFKNASLIEKMSTVLIVVLGRSILAGYLIMNLIGYMFFYGMFLYLLFGGFPFNTSPINNLLILASQVYTSILLLFISHGFSFFINFILGDERKNSKIADYKFEPYKRIVFMHIAMFVGAFVFMPYPKTGRLFFMIALVILKIITDSFGHIQERIRFSIAQEPSIIL